MTETPAFLAERLKAEGDKTHAFFAALTPEQWQLNVYTEGELWTVRNVLSHFVSAEKGFISVFSGIRDGGSGVREDFDLDRYNAGQQRKSMDLNPAQLLLEFGAVRAQMITFVAGLKDADLALQGRHPFLGQTTLAEMIKMIYRHNQIHYRDMRKVVGQG